MNKTEESNTMLDKDKTEIEQDHVEYNTPQSNFLADSWMSTRSCFGSLFSFFNFQSKSENSERDQAIENINDAIIRQTVVIENANEALCVQINDLDEEVEQYKALLLARGITPKKPSGDLALNPVQKAMAHAIGSKLAQDIVVPEESNKDELQHIYVEIEESTAQLEHLFVNFIEQTAQSKQSMNALDLAESQHQAINNNVF